MRRLQSSLVCMSSWPSYAFRERWLDQVSLWHRMYLMQHWHDWEIAEAICVYKHFKLKQALPPPSPPSFLAPFVYSDTLTYCFVHFGRYSTAKSYDCCLSRGGKVQEDIRYIRYQPQKDGRYLGKGLRVTHHGIDVNPRQMLTLQLFSDDISIGLLIRRLLCTYVKATRET